MRSQVALCLQAQRSWQSAPKLPGGHSVGHSRAAQRAASHQAGWAVCMEQLYLTRRISQSIPVCRCRTHRWHCTALHSGRSKSAGSPARTAAVGSLQDKGTVLGTAGNRCPPETGGCQGALQVSCRVQLPCSSQLPCSQVGPTLPGGHRQSPVTWWHVAPSPQAHSCAQSAP